MKLPATLIERCGVIARRHGVSVMDVLERLVLIGECLETLEAQGDQAPGSIVNVDWRTGESTTLTLFCECPACQAMIAQHVARG